MCVLNNFFFLMRFNYRNRLLTKAVEYVVASIAVSESPHNIVAIVLPVVVAETTIISTLVGIKAKCVKA